MVCHFMLLVMGFRKSTLPVVIGRWLQVNKHLSATVFLQQKPIIQSLIMQFFIYRSKLQTGWKDGLVDSVERLMERSDRSTPHPVDTWPRVQSALPTHGCFLLKAAVMPAVRFVWHCELQKIIICFKDIFKKKFISSIRMPHETWICEAGEAGDIEWPGI